MNTRTILDPECWARETFGRSNLKDIRRTGRAIQVASLMAKNPSGSLPDQMHTWKGTIALYRLLDEEDVTFEALMQPHWDHTREQIEAQPAVLLVQDTTEVDLSHHPKTRGVGQIGNQRGRGLYLQTVLALVPQTGEVLGCAVQEPFVRTPAPVGETRSKRRQRDTRETDVWMRLVHRLGGIFPAETLVVHVGDRGADLFPFFQACQVTHTHFLVRGFENRRLQPEGDEQGHLLDEVRSWPTQANRPLQVPASHGRTARSTTVQLAFGKLTVLPPRFETRCGKEPLSLWAIRVWEEDTPAEEEPLEWLWLTSVPTLTLEHAWERVNWYEHRWVVEEYHQGLKTGCHLEQRQVQSVDRLKRLLGFLSPLAGRLLQLRDLARRDPERPACEVLDTDVLAIVATQTGQPPTTMTTQAFWKAVAQMGGYLARRGDGPPGWKTLWKGWLRLQTLLEGVHLAFHLRL
ncbi:MAG TPA: IS4 family transposase [Ktedonobacteraceae bacterium]|nr:IS4 family transposase [Ktedonobacteraceae bacterium]